MKVSCLLACRRKVAWQNSLWCFANAGPCIPWLCHRSALRQDKRAEALKECVKMINAPGGGCCTVFPYEAAIWLLEEQEELVGTNKRSINRCCTCLPVSLLHWLWLHASKPFATFVKRTSCGQCAQAFRPCICCRNPSSNRCIWAHNHAGARGGFVNAL